MSNSNTETQSPIPLEDITACVRNQTPPRSADQYQILVIDESMAQQTVCIDDPVPTGLQVLETAGYLPASDYLLLKFQGNAILEEINLSEKVDIYEQGVERFIVFNNDRLFYFELNGKRLPWGTEHISEATLRALADVPSEHTLWLEKRARKDKELKPDSTVNLGKSGLERIYSLAPTWDLNVHGVKVTSDQPTILASEAMQLAGFDPADGWILILKVKGEPKQNITVNDVIDLTKPGIEKLRLTPAEINNGEASKKPRMDFSLLEKDATYLNALGLTWETYVENTRRWLIIRNYALPEGYNQTSVDIAIDVPASYPDAAIDMFYCRPPLQLTSGASIPQTSCSVPIDGSSFQQWSRHLNGRTRWNPAFDSVITHLAVVEESILREVGQ